MHVTAVPFSQCAYECILSKEEERKTTFNEAKTLVYHHVQSFLNVFTIFPENSSLFIVKSHIFLVLFFKYPYSGRLCSFSMWCGFS